MTHHATLAAFTALALLFAPICAHAQETDTAREPEANAINLYERAAANNSLFEFDWGVPSSPALSLAGLSPDKTPTSSSLKDFVVALPSILNGDEQGQSLAIDFAPAALMGERGRATFNEYRRDGNYWGRLMRRTRIGGAIYEGNDGGDNPSTQIASRLAIGLSASLLDDSDPLMQRDPNDREGRPYLLTCLNRASNRVHAALADEYDRELFVLREQRRQAQEDFAGAQTDAARARHHATIDDLTRRIDIRVGERVQRIQDRLTASAEGERSTIAEIERCAQDNSFMAERARDLDVGIGALWRGEPGEFSDFDDAGAAGWVAFRMPMGQLFGRSEDGTLEERAYWRLAMSARLSHDEYVATGDDATPEMRANVSEGWIGVERFSDDLRLAAHYGYREVDASEAAGEAFEQSGERYLVSGQIRLGGGDSGLWLGLSYGDASGSVSALDDEVALVTLSFSPPPRYDIGR